MSCRLNALFYTCFALACACAQNPAANQAFARAIEMHRSGNLNGAVAEYQAVLAADPSRFDARSNLGAVFAKLGRYQDAITQYQQAIPGAPPNAVPMLRLNLALAYYKELQIPKAVSELTKVHAEQPANLNATLLLADCHLRLGEFSEVIDLLTPLETAQPDNRAITYMLGTALIRDGKVELGQQRVDKILREGDSAEGRFLLGTGMFMARDYPGAVKEFARAIAIDPQMPSLQSYYGQALLATGDADGAEQAFRKELTANPNDFDANVRLGEILAHRGRTAEAKPFFDHATILRPGFTPATNSKPDSLGGLKIGDLAPDSDLIALRRNLAHGPVVLVFGSYTCPRFRGDAPSLNTLYAKYGGRVAFEMVYVNEAHAGGQWQSTINQREGVDLPDPKNLAEKQEHLSLCVRALKIPYKAVVDGMDRTTETAYQGWPSRVYLIGTDGRVKFNSPLGELDFRVAELDRAIAAALGKK